MEGAGAAKRRSAVGVRCGQGHRSPSQLGGWRLGENCQKSTLKSRKIYFLHFPLQCRQGFQLGTIIATYMGLAR